MSRGPAPRRCAEPGIGRHGEEGAPPQRLPHYGHIFSRDRFFPCLPWLFIAAPLHINPSTGHPRTLPNFSVFRVRQKSSSFIPKMLVYNIMHRLTLPPHNAHGHVSIIQRVRVRQ